MKIFFFFRHFRQDRSGSTLMFILIFGAAATTIIVSGVASYGIYEHRVSLRHHQRDQAFHIAEAGVNYYRWHLAHAPRDYQDGTGTPGPYVHPYADKNGTTIGYYSLQIQPPLPGSMVVGVSSTGWTIWRPEVERTVAVRLGFPALTDYTFLSNANMAFGFTSRVNGTVHSNGGIRFDGESDSWVRSARDNYQYYNPASGRYETRNGIWGGGGPKTFWQFPVPAIDFFSVSADLVALRASAVTGGRIITSSGREGWHIVFRGAVYDLYRVDSRDCYRGSGRWRWRRNEGWYWDGTTYCYDIRNQALVSSNNALPANGALFVEDDVWVEGVVDGRVTVGAGIVQRPYYQIYINGNLTYAARGADDVIGLINQGDIIVPYEVPDTMTIEAALLSQFGTIYRPFYDSNTKSSLTIFGSQIYYEQGGMKYVNGFGNIISGFINTNYLYDGNLRYFPPSGFPVGNTYELISWEEAE